MSEAHDSSFRSWKFAAPEAYQLQIRTSNLASSTASDFFSVKFDCHFRVERRKDHQHGRFVSVFGGHEGGPPSPGPNCGRGPVPTSTICGPSKWSQPPLPIAPNQRRTLLRLPWAGDLHGVGVQRRRHQAEHAGIPALFSPEWCHGRGSSGEIALLTSLTPRVFDFAGKSSWISFFILCIDSWCRSRCVLVFVCRVFEPSFLSAEGRR